MDGIWEQKNWAECQLIIRFSKLNWVIFFIESFINHLYLKAVESMCHTSQKYVHLSYFFRLGQITRIC